MREFTKIPPGIVRRSVRSFFLKKHVRAFETLPNGGVVTLLDLGAAGEIEPRWRPYANFLHYIGFEPDERSRKALIENENSFVKEYEILPYAVWETDTKVRFNLCRKPRLSSLLLPNREFLDLFPNSRRFDIVQSELVDVVRVDDVISTPVDFIKVDIQGAGLSALKGAKTTISRAFGLEMEVEFLPIYDEQPLFGEVSSWLSRKGFDLIDFVNLARWERSDRNDHGQCVWGDALYLRSPEKMKFEQQSINRIAAYLAVLLVYRRFDLLDMSFAKMPRKELPNFAEFRSHVERLRRVDMWARRINRVSSMAVSNIGPGYRSHLFY